MLGKTHLGIWGSFTVILPEPEIAMLTSHVETHASTCLGKELPSEDLGHQGLSHPGSLAGTAYSRATHRTQA